MRNPPTHFDGAWKEALEHFFPAFLGLCFPQAHADIDWTQPPQFLDAELQQIAPEETTGRQHADKLVRVTRRNGADAWLLVHIEVQSQRDRTFATRMFRYHARIYDRYQRQVVSLAVLGDRALAWRPDQFGYELWGCALKLTFPMIKLAALDQAALAAQSNPFATVILLHLDAQTTRGNPQQRLTRKLAQFRRLLGQGLAASELRALIRLLDWLLRLPPPLMLEARASMKQIAEEANMSGFVTSFEELGRAEGRAEGQRLIVLRLLARRVGALDQPTEAQIVALPPAALDALAEALLDFIGPADLATWLAEHQQADV